MFLIMGISSEEKKINFFQMMICMACGRYTRLDLFVSYTYFSLFFIPIFKWNKHYYVRSQCCSATYEITKELGTKVEKGNDIELTSEDLTPVYKYYSNNKCRYCGYSIIDDFEYCPKCGQRLK